MKRVGGKNKMNELTRLRMDVDQLKYIMEKVMEDLGLELVTIEHEDGKGYTKTVRKKHEPSEAAPTQVIF
jgi:hypothetical protein